MKKIELERVKFSRSIKIDLKVHSKEKGYVGDERTYTPTFFSMFHSWRSSIWYRTITLFPISDTILHCVWNRYHLSLDFPLLSEDCVLQDNDDWLTTNQKKNSRQIYKNINFDQKLIIYHKHISSPKLWTMTSNTVSIIGCVYRA